MKGEENSIPRTPLLRGLFLLFVLGILCFAALARTQPTSADSILFAALHFRGGTGVVFDNTVTGNFGNGILVVNHCSCPDMICSWEPCTTYPCIDQIGRSSESNQDGAQDLEPLYELNNTFNGGNLDIEVQNACSETCIQEGRDFYIDRIRPDYVPYVYLHPLVQLDLPATYLDLKKDGTIDVLYVQLSTNVLLGTENDPGVVS